MKYLTYYKLVYLLGFSRNRYKHNNHVVFKN